MDHGNYTLDERIEHYKTVIAGLTMMSDMFMRNVLKDWRCAEYILQVIMQDRSLKVIDVAVQKDYKNLQGRSAVLDCIVRGRNENIYNIEIQQKSDEAPPERARYYTGLIDMNTLDPGDSFEKLPETWIIFITQRDVLKRGLPIYHVERKILETDEPFGDRSHIIYVNAEVTDQSELGMLMHDLQCSKPEEMHSRILANRVDMLKNSQGGLEIMCSEMKKIEDYGREQGQRQAAEATILRMLEDHVPHDLIAKYNGVSIEEVEKLAYRDIA